MVPALLLEICLLLKSRRVASVRAVTVCDLYSLRVDDFHAVLRDFPDIRKIMEAVAQERLSMIQAMLDTESGSVQSEMESEQLNNFCQNDNDLTPISEGDSESDSCRPNHIV